MDPIFSKVLNLYNPLLGTEEFFNVTYPFFFWGLLVYLIVQFANNRKTWNLTRQLLEKIPKYYKITFLILSFIFVISSVFTMDSRYNVVPPNSEVVYQADYYTENFKFDYIEVPLGLASLIIPFAFLFEINVFLSYLGIILGLFSGFFIGLIVKQITRSNLSAIIAVGLFYFMSTTRLYFSSFVTPITLSMTGILFLLFLLVVDVKWRNLKIISFLCLMLAYFRIENLIFVIVILGYYMFDNRQKLFSKQYFQNLSVWNFLFFYLFSLPITIILSGSDAFAGGKDEIFMWSGALVRLFTFSDYIKGIFSNFMIIIFIIGLFVSLKKKAIPFLIVFATLVVYSFRSYYAYIPDIHLMNLFLVIIVITGIGFSIFLKSKQYRIIAIPLLLFVIFTGIDIAFFTDSVPHQGYNQIYIAPHEQIQDIVNGGTVIISGYPDLIVNYGNFYSDAIIHDGNSNIRGQADYFINFMEGGPEAAIVGNVNNSIEHVTSIGIVHLYSIKNN